MVQVSAQLYNATGLGIAFSSAEERSFTRAVSLALTPGASLLFSFAPLSQNFLESTASQLTEVGLIALHESLHPNELAVFFRNNHFSTIFNHEGRLYLLITDVGFLHEVNSLPIGRAAVGDRLIASTSEL
jgi:hypothetical protein